MVTIFVKERAYVLKARALVSFDPNDIQYIIPRDPETGLYMADWDDFFADPHRPLSSQPESDAK